MSKFDRKMRLSEFFLKLHVTDEFPHIEKPQEGLTKTKRFPWHVQENV